MPANPRPSTTGSSPSRNAFRSMPEQNEPPAPVSTPTESSGSRSRSSTAAASPRASAAFTALRAFGRFRVITRIAPSRSVRTSSSVTVPPVASGRKPILPRMRDAVIVEAVRTPVGKRNGGLSGVHPVDLTAHVLEALAARSGVDPAVVDDVVWGCVSQVGEQTFDIARSGVLAAGWPETVTGVTLDRQCGSSQQSVHFAAAGLVAGQYDVVVAGGVESMSRVPMGSSVAGADPFGPRFAARYDGARPNQGVGAEMMAERWGFSRADLDEYSVGSHEKAAAARAEGRFVGQIAPVTTADGVVSEDEGIRPGSSVASLAGLKTVFKPDGVITAGNASQISDGAAALLMTTSEKARELGLTPIARVHTAVPAGGRPAGHPTAPLPAAPKAPGPRRRAGRRNPVFRGDEGPS